ncbi:MAG: S-layer homology domain-containing protein [Oscillospiraceae bacterium]|nr:S-layer homology domain-containing protein [Oscillospiraceae bacterium]
MKKFRQLFLLCLAAVLCFATIFSAFADGDSLIAENLEISTYRGVAVGGRLSVADIGAEVIGFEITTKPTKGEIELGDDGCFVYTPDEGKRGKDYFGYKAIDAEGKYSQEATVIISIKKQKTRVTYSDMEGNPSAWAAVTLAEEGIFVGETLAGEYVFRPDESVTRSQFLTMCMKAAGSELMWDIEDTGFADDESIATWLKPYVGTAFCEGYVRGNESENGTVFAGDELIGAMEAAYILDNVSSITDVVAVWFSFDQFLPEWAVQSAANLSACEIVPDSLSLLDETVSRSEAAEMICRAMALVEKRG